MSEHANPGAVQRIALLADSRFGVRHGDAYEMLQGETTDSWDLVLIDVDHAPDDHLGADNETFYTRPGLERAKCHLAPGGILAVWSYAESSPFVLSRMNCYQKHCDLFQKNSMACRIKRRGIDNVI